MSADLSRYATDVNAFIDDMIKVNELGRPFRLSDYQREINRAAFVFDKDGRLPWDTFVDARIKKSSKTFDHGCRLTWWSYTQEPPNELYVLANDKDQALGRVFAMAARIIQKNPALASSAKVETARILLSNGSVIVGLACDAAGNAGSNQGFTSWDELWAYLSELSRKLWEEMTPVPTRRNSIRLVTTYAGFENESDLLWDLYTLGVGPEEHPQGQGERIHPTLPLYMNREARLLVLWDHEARFPWQTPQYYSSQRRSLRPNTFLRLHENRWTAAEGTFIEPEAWDACVEPTWEQADADTDLPAWGSVDVGVKHDAAAVVAVTVDPATGQVVLVRHRLWTPTPAAPIDLERTVERAVRELHAQFRLRVCVYDPYQFHRSATTLARDGIPMREFPQTVPNLTRMAKLLDDLLRDRQLVLYPSPEMRAHALAAAAQESAAGYRIVKRTASRRIDSLVALAMAAQASVDYPAMAPLTFSSL